MRSGRRRTLVVLATAVLAACGEGASRDAGAGSVPPVTDDVSPTGSIDGTWRMVAGSVDGAPIAMVDGWAVTMDVEGNRIGGTAACNGYGGEVRVGRDGSFGVAELASTEMACEPRVMDVEQAVVRALLGATAYELIDGRLVLDGPAVSLTFDSVPPVPTADIVGTTWVLDTYIEGDAATNVPIMELATLRLDSDGTLEGSTGCRRLDGEWVEAGAEIVFTMFSAIDDPAAGVCAPDAERLDGQIISVLEGGFSATVAGDRLTVMSQGGQGLSFTAGR